MIFLHGLESSSQTYKASVMRKSYPEIIVPDFTGPLEERMQALYPILNDKKDWTIIGSSFGGLMGAIFTCEHPNQVQKQVLLAPALMLPEFASDIHGMLFEPLTKKTMNYISRGFKEIIEAWDDRVVIDEVSIARDPDRNQVALEFLFQIRGYAGVFIYQTHIRGDYP